MPYSSAATRLLENLTTAIILVDAGLRVEYLNPAAEDLLHISGHRRIGEPVKSLFRENDANSSGLERAAASGTGFTKRQSYLELAGGVQTLVDYIVTPYADDQATGFVIEIQPLDRLMRISRDEEMMASQQRTQKMIRGLAHEIKNPLGGLRGAAQLLARELPAEHLLEYTNVIIEEADRLGRLVDQMLGAPQKLTLEPLNVHQVIERVRQLVEAETGSIIDVTRDYDPSIPEFDADKEGLIQALLNIARNATHALLDQANPPPQPSITLRTRAQRQLTLGNNRHRLVCRIDIIDNGPGIPEEIADTLFLPMVSGHADGSGLGLTIAQSIVTRHGGLISCGSEGGMTMFSIYLPVEGVK